MKSSAIRVIVVLAVLACAGIIVTQVYWVQRIARVQEKAFNLNVLSALRSTALDVARNRNVQLSSYSVVEKQRPDYYIIQTNVAVEQAVLQHFLISRFTEENVITDFEYFLYDCSSDTMQYRAYYHMRGTGEKKEPGGTFPNLKRDNYYVGVYFPHRKAYLTSQLSVWTVSSFVLLCVVGFLGYLLFIIFKQKRLSEVQKDFVNNMTHEFKTPLSTIQLSADVLKNPDIVNQPQRLLNYATIISNESVQLTAQVERVLQMARAERGDIQLNKESFVWQNLLREMQVAFEQLAMAKGCSIAWLLPEKDIPFVGDVLHLKNAISNLVDNALKYCETTPAVTVALKEGKGIVEISVKDNGIGIDKQYQKLLFQKFYRVPTGNIHNVKGFGLGLNYVRLIAKAHGGHVSCESSLAKGSIFTITFPL